jgi:hypothetical protein
MRNISGEMCSVTPMTIAMGNQGECKSLDSLPIAQLRECAGATA